MKLLILFYESSQFARVFKEQPEIATTLYQQYVARCQTFSFEFGCKIDRVDEGDLISSYPMKISIIPADWELYQNVIPFKLSEKVILKVFKKLDACTLRKIAPLFDEDIIEIPEAIYKDTVPDAIYLELFNILRSANISIISDDRNFHKLIKSSYPTFTKKAL